MGIFFFDSLQFIMDSWHYVTHMTIVNSFQKCGCNVNLTSDGENETEFIIAKVEGSCVSSRMCIM